MHSARAGDRLAFARLHRRFAPLVHGLLLAHVAPQDVSDLLQEVFLRVLESLPSLERPESFPGWLVSVTRNRARDWQRRRQRPLPLGEGAEPSDELRPEEQREAREESEIVLAVIRGLPQAYRETLVLRLVEGLSGERIAERTGLTHGSVRVNLCRGMRLLREALEERAR